MSFEQSLAFGQLGEGYIARWLRRKGYHVLPVYEKHIKTGKGPQLFTADGSSLVAPDLFCFNSHNQIRWIEAKTKSAFTWYRNGGVWNTGIDLHHYEQYQKVDALTGWPVWLFFLQLPGEAKDTPPGKISPTGLYGNPLRVLVDNVCHKCPPEEYGRSGMVYWRPEHLTKHAELEEVLNIAEAH